MLHFSLFPYCTESSKLVFSDKPVCFIQTTEDRDNLLVTSNCWVVTGWFLSLDEWFLAIDFTANAGQGIHLLDGHGAVSRSV